MHRIAFDDSIETHDANFSIHQPTECFKVVASCARFPGPKTEESPSGVCWSDLVSSCKIDQLPSGPLAAMPRLLEPIAPPLAESNHLLAGPAPSAPHLYLAPRTKTPKKICPLPRGSFGFFSSIAHDVSQAEKRITPPSGLLWHGLRCSRYTVKKMVQCFQV